MPAERRCTIGTTTTTGDDRRRFSSATDDGRGRHVEGWRSLLKDEGEGEEEAMRTKRALAALTAALLVALCGCSGFGKCPKHPYVKDFNMSRFLGRWYEVERSFYIMELTSTCMDIDLTANARGQIAVEVNTKSVWSGNPTVTRGIITQTRKDPSVFSYKASSALPNALARHLPGTGIYQVLNTDYVNYAILWTCSSLGLIHTDRVWIFGRQRDLDVKLRTDIYNFLASRDIDSERLILPKRANCTE